MVARYFLIIVHLLLCQIDSVVTDAALRCAAGDEEDTVMLGGGVGTTDDVVKVFLRADGTVVDLMRILPVRI